jgi:ABC-type uncharacterized transport system YnjBCD ATPase subunit
MSKSPVKSSFGERLRIVSVARLLVAVPNIELIAMPFVAHDVDHQDVRKALGSAICALSKA